MIRASLRPETAVTGSGAGTAQMPGATPNSAGDATAAEAADLGLCRVIGCGKSMEQEPRYHKRLGICQEHLGASKVLLPSCGDSPQRFCQQCSKFHDITEFDGEKRSCRAKLAAHALRRRMKLARQRMEKVRAQGDGAPGGSPPGGAGGGSGALPGSSWRRGDRTDSGSAEPPSPAPSAPLMSRPSPPPPSGRGLVLLGTPTFDGGMETDAAPRLPVPLMPPSRRRRPAPSETPSGEAPPPATAAAAGFLAGASPQGAALPGAGLAALGLQGAAASLAGLAEALGAAGAVKMEAAEAAAVGPSGAADPYQRDSQRRRLSPRADGDEPAPRSPDPLLPSPQLAALQQLLGQALLMGRGLPAHAPDLAALAAALRGGDVHAVGGGGGGGGGGGLSAVVAGLERSDGSGGSGSSGAAGRSDGGGAAGVPLKAPPLSPQSWPLRLLPEPPGGPSAAPRSPLRRSTGSGYSPSPGLVSGNDPRPLPSNPLPPPDTDARLALAGLLSSSGLGALTAQQALRPEGPGGQVPGSGQGQGHEESGPRGLLAIDPSFAPLALRLLAAQAGQHAQHAQHAHQQQQQQAQAAGSPGSPRPAAALGGAGLHGLEGLQALQRLQGGLQALSGLEGLQALHRLEALHGVPALQGGPQGLGGGLQSLKTLQALQALQDQQGRGLHGSAQGETADASAPPASPPPPIPGPRALAPPRPQPQPQPQLQEHPQPSPLRSSPPLSRTQSQAAALRAACGRALSGHSAGPPPDNRWPLDRDAGSPQQPSPPQSRAVAPESWRSTAPEQARGQRAGARDGGWRNDDRPRPQAPASPGPIDGLRGLLAAAAAAEHGPGPSGPGPRGMGVKEEPETQPMGVRGSGDAPAAAEYGAVEYSQALAEQAAALAAVADAAAAAAAAGASGGRGAGSRAPALEPSDGRAQPSQWEGFDLGSQVHQLLAAQLATAAQAASPSDLLRAHLLRMLTWQEPAQ